MTAPVTFAFEEQKADSPDSALQNASAGLVLQEADLRDYLFGWNRYCKSLRCVQLSREAFWERRFVGDKWAERVVEVSVKGSELVSSPFR